MYFFSYCKLDEILRKEGPTSCQNYYQKTINENRQLALKLINDSRITFPCLYVLIPILETKNMHSNLRENLRESYNFTKSILAHEPSNLGKSVQNKTMLKWIFESSFSFYHLGGEFNEVIDVTVSILVNEYKDVTILNKVCELIFLRNRDNENIHDLVWAYFRLQTPMTLRHISKYLDSKNKIDKSLAKSLLGIQENNQRRYLSYLSENEPFMYYTDESFQFASNPKVYKVDHKSKFLCKRGRNVPLSKDEEQIIDGFKRLDEEDQAVLADYSFALSKMDNAKWKEFLNKETDLQLKEAKEGRMV